MASEKVSQMYNVLAWPRKIVALLLMSTEWIPVLKTVAILDKSEDKHISL